jgi:hypothetical protein
VLVEPRHDLACNGADDGRASGIATMPFEEVDDEVTGQGHTVLPGERQPLVLEHRPLGDDPPPRLGGRRWARTSRIGRRRDEAGNRRPRTGRRSTGDGRDGDLVEETHVG